MNAGRTAGHLAEKLAAPHDEDAFDSVETELASALGGIVVLVAIIVIALMVVGYKAARSLL